MHWFNFIVDATVIAFIIASVFAAGTMVLLNWPAKKPLKGPRPLQR